MVTTLLPITGVYRVFHPDYTMPLEVIVKQNKMGTIFWSAAAEGSEIFRQKMFLGPKENFAQLVYLDLAVDTRPAIGR